ncbi:phytanoyl-CoA dioxygenase family protein [Sphingomonas sp. AP4-R1]|uniref:phytanoyl-CoA dioxygenase family protein n=1 Tax=Sphingomonas sp. AP4-R1 TaxID=2735134 RepID=UPI001493B850|nr:phytanoyl-CoA dioxygenase family protein [Sphingomonas sp. AP4-R1]QJU59342.1 phytanoyl-CoA dioxygenase family protein [Sphingomonas sp. AP4-R1]
MNAAASRLPTPSRNVDGGAIASELLDRGVCLVRSAVREDLVQALSRDFAPTFAATPRSTGVFYGGNTKRFHSLLRRSPHMAAFVLQEAIFEAVTAILGPHCDTIQLNLTQAIELLPGGMAQPPHRDQDMWPLQHPGVEYLINVMWPLTPYRAENGTTIVWPGSHRRQQEIVMSDDEALPVEMDPGDALLFLGSTLHCGGVNRTQTSRRGMIVSYSLGWLKPYELPWLAYPPHVASTFHPDLAALAGYRAHRPNLGTYEGRCPSATLQPAGDELGAIDALRPEQERLIALYREGALQPGTPLAARPGSAVPAKT